MAAGDFTIGDDTGAAATDLTTLFGVAEGVGDAPVYLTGPRSVPGGFGPGVGPGGPGTRGPATTEPGQSRKLVETLQGFYGLDGAGLRNLQEQLWAGGFFSSSFYGPSGKQPQYGSADDDSYAAFKKAAVQAARSGKPLPDVLRTAIDSVNAGGGVGSVGKTAKAQPILQPTSATDLYAQIEESQKKKFGHGVISRSQIESIIGDYQALEADRQRRVQQAQIDNTAATVTQAPNMQSYVENRLGQAAPKEAALNDSLHAADLVMQLFGGAGNG